jgi:large subunit ribosomal protein L22
MTKQPNPRRAAENEALATGKMLRVSARKLDLVAGLIRGKTAATALADLSFSKRRIAGEVKRVLQSAIANAENNHQLDVDRLEVSEASVGKSLVMRRVMPRARGRAAAIRKPFSRITVVVRERAADASDGGAKPSGKGKSRAGAPPAQARAKGKAQAKQRGRQQGKALTKSKAQTKGKAQTPAKAKGKSEANKAKTTKPTRGKEKD